jgi:hypothetical protein
MRASSFALIGRDATRCDRHRASGPSRLGRRRAVVRGRANQSTRRTSRRPDEGRPRKDRGGWAGDRPRGRWQVRRRNLDRTSARRGPGRGGTGDRQMVSDLPYHAAADAFDARQFIDRVEWVPGAVSQDCARLGGANSRQESQQFCRGGVQIHDTVEILAPCVASTRSDKLR